MKLQEMFAQCSLKSNAREIGLELRMAGGHLVCSPLDANDPRYSMDFVLPSPKMVRACRADDFDFFQPFIEEGRLTTEQMHRAAARYHLGKTRSGRPIFWMMDEEQTPLDAHIGTGTPKRPEAWISTLLRAREPLLRYWHPMHCLYGQHLLPSGRNLPVAIVEREEAALVLSELFPASLWMAYVTPAHLDIGLFAPLRGRTVTFYPRTDPTFSTYLFFHDLAAAVRRQCGISVTVASILEDHATDEQRARCIDLLDFLCESRRP